MIKDCIRHKHLPKGHVIISTKTANDIDKTCFLVEDLLLIFGPTVIEVINETPGIRL